MTTENITNDTGLVNQVAAMFMNSFPVIYQFIHDVFGGQVWILIIIFFLVLIFIIDFILRLTLNFLNKLFLRKGQKFFRTITIALKAPISFYIWLSGFALALNTIILTFPNFNEFTNYVNSSKSTLALISVAWFSIRWVNEIETYVKALEQDSRWDSVSIEAMVKVFKLTIFVFTILFVLSAFGVNLTALLAFGGVGGIAVGFAAKDFLSNLIGGLVIYMDKPFKVGDWIRSPDQIIEGTVEKIGWRMTVVRTFDRRPLYIPNGTFLTISIENPSRMSNRRIKEIIGVRYDDMEQVANITAAIKKMLLEHKEIDTRQTIIVNLTSFGASTVDILVYTFTKTVNWVKFHGVKEDILLNIAKIISNYDAEIAYPTQTLHLTKNNEHLLNESNH